MPVFKRKGINPAKGSRKREIITETDAFKKFVGKKASTILVVPKGTELTLGAVLEKSERKTEPWKAKRKTQIIRFLNENQKERLEARVNALGIKEKVLEVLKKMPKNLSHAERNFRFSVEMQGFLLDAMGIQGVRRRRLNRIFEQQTVFDYANGLSRSGQFVPVKITRRLLEYSLQNARYVYKLNQKGSKELARKGITIKKLEESLETIRKEELQKLKEADQNSWQPIDPDILKMSIKIIAEQITETLDQEERILYTLIHRKIGESIPR